MSNKNSYYDKKNKIKYNYKKGTIVDYKSHTTYIKDPPIEDSITKVVKTSTFNVGYFFKSIGVFIIILFISSFALNGYLDSRIVSAQTEETITHTYQKQIGTEIVGGDFDDFTYDNFGELTFNKKIYFKKQVPSASEIISISSSSTSGNGYYGLRFVASNFKLYDDNNNLLYSYSYNTEFILLYNFRYKAYSKNLEYLYFSIYNLTGVQSTVFICDIIGNQISNNSNYNIKYPTASYFTYSNYYNSISNIAFYGLNYGRITFSDNFFNIILNDNLIYDDVLEVPIYETTTYTYNVKDVNYDWDKKIQQLNKFKPLFKREDFEENKSLIYDTLITYTLYGEVYNSSVADYNKLLILDYYKDDEFIKFLLDNEFITIKYLNKGGVNFLNKYPQYYSYIDMDNFVQQYDNILLMFPQYEDEIIGRVDYINENYVTNFNIEDYRTYMERDLTLKDIFLAPITFVHNVVYNFGVLIGLITIW